MRQQIKVIRVGSLGMGYTAQDIEENINVTWAAMTGADGLRPRLEKVYPLGEGFVLLVFGDNAVEMTVLPIRQPQEVEA